MYWIDHVYYGTMHCASGKGVIFGYKPLSSLNILLCYESIYKIINQISAMQIALFSYGRNIVQCGEWNGKSRFISWFY
jgi:hypothetical protein